MPLSDVVKTQFDNGTISLSDGTTPTALELTARFDQGSFSVSGIQDALRDIRAYQSRGKLRSLRKGERVFPTGSFSVMLTEFSETSVGTLLDWLLKTASTPFENRVSTTADIGDADTSDVTFTMEGTDYGDSADHAVTFHDMHLVADLSEGDPNTLTVNWTLYGGISGDLSIVVDA